MKRDFDLYVIDVDGKTPVPSDTNPKIQTPQGPVFAPPPEGRTLKPMTFAEAAVTALLAPSETREDLGRKTELFRLAIRLQLGGVQEVDDKEMTMIKEKVAAVYIPIVVGRVVDFLDTDPEASAVKATAKEQP